MVMFQFGAAHIKFNDCTQSAAKVAPHLTEYVKIAVRIPNLDKSNNFDKDVKSSFEKASVAVIGQKLLYKDQLPFFIKTYDDMKFKRRGPQ